MKQRIKTISALIICCVLLGANDFLGPNNFESIGEIDLANLYNYENQYYPEKALYRWNEDNPVTDIGATLGRVLFYDKKLSANNSISCASCHQQENAFGDNRIVALGFEGQATLRHPMRLVNTDFGSDNKRFWDERVTTLEQLATQPIQDPIEMGFTGQDGYPGMDDLIEKLNQEEYYKTLFSLTFGDEEITEERIGKALAQFIRSIFVFDSRFDIGYEIVGNEKTDFPNFTDQENRGKSMFFNFPGGDPSFPQTFGTGCGLCHKAPDMSIIHLSQNNGVIGVAGNPDEIDLTVERSPSLKAIIKPDGTSNGPFMHDGSLETLDDVIDHYNDIPHEPLNTNLGGLLFPETSGDVNLNLSDESKADLKAFLLTLAGSDVYTNIKWSDPFDVNGNIKLLNNPNCTDKNSLIFLSICQGEAYEGYSSTGIYQDTFDLGNNCDSIRIIELSVLAPSFSSESVEICEGEEYNGLNQSGEYTNIFTASNGCDSIHTLSLYVLPEFLVEQTVEICEGEEYMGLTESGITTFIFTATNGCDSLYTLNLIVLDITNPACSPSSNQETEISKIQLNQNISDSRIIGTVEKNGIYHLQIFNSRGQAIYKDSRLINENFELNIENLPSGIYFLRAQQKDLHWTERFIKT